MAVPEEGLRLVLSPSCGTVVTRTACCTVSNPGNNFLVYHSSTAIEEKDRDEQEVRVFYWACFASFSLVKVLSDKTSTLHKAAFAFQTIKTGAEHLYARHLLPFLLKHRNKLALPHDSAGREVTEFKSAGTSKMVKRWLSIMWVAELFGVLQDKRFSCGVNVLMKCGFGERKDFSLTLKVPLRLPSILWNLMAARANVEDTLENMTDRPRRQYLVEGPDGDGDADQSSASSES